MMRFSTLIKNPAEWMIGGSTDHAVVLTSRIRLARNLRRHPFPGWTDKAQRVAALQEILPVVEKLKEMKDAFSQPLQALTIVQKQALVERHLISRELAARGEGCAAVIERRQQLSIMINEEDHLRLQSIRSGLNLHAAFDAISQVDDALQASLEFAFSRKFGFLTTCPTNLGTGMRASAMLHLPALALSEHINQVIHGINRLGLAVRGLYGEGTDSMGHLFQISNQSTLGQSEQTIIEHLTQIIREVVQHEINARQKLLEEQPALLQDKIGRAFGLLRHAHTMKADEALNLLSMLRLGCHLGFFPASFTRTCDSLLLEIQPAHLQLNCEAKLSAADRDLLRSKTIRSQLQDVLPPASLS